jgi:hypothetical protein
VPQHAIGEFEDVQTDRVAGGRLVVADNTFGMQRAQDVVGGAAVEACNVCSTLAVVPTGLPQPGSQPPHPEGSHWSARFQGPLPRGCVLSNPLAAARPSSRLIKPVDLYRTT